MREAGRSRSPPHSPAHHENQGGFGLTPWPGAGIPPPSLPCQGAATAGLVFIPLPPGMTQVFPLKQHQNGGYCSPAPPRARGTSVTHWGETTADGKCQRSLQSQPESTANGGYRAPPGLYCRVRTWQQSHHPHHWQQWSKDAPGASQAPAGPQLHTRMLQPPVCCWEGLWGSFSPSLPPSCTRSTQLHPPAQSQPALKRLKLQMLVKCYK